MERVDADAEMEGVLARGLGNVLVGADTAGFEGFRRKLLIFVRHEVNAEWEVINRGTLAAKVVNADLIKRSAQERNYSLCRDNTFGSGTPRL